MSEEHLLVLLVDDEASLRTPLARYLSNMYGYHVDTAANEEEAWERVLRAERPYGVALIDDLLTPKPGAEPEPIGIGLMARIRERCPETECIIFTGWGMDRALEALQAGAYRYLAKPLNLGELGMTLRMAAEQGRLRRERDLLSATLEISRAMLTELDVGKTLEVIAEAVPKLVGAEACAVAQVDPAKDQVWREPMVPMGDAAVRWYRHLQGVELTKRIFETGEVFVLPDVDACIDEVDRNLRRAGVKSFIGVPIPGAPQNLGVLYAYSARREVFGAYERRVLQLLAGQAAIALENARLFEAETQRRREAETLRETALALTTTLEQQEIFERILTELQKVVPYDSASVQLLKGNRLEIIGGHGFPNLQAILGFSFPVDGDNPNREVVRRRDWLIVPDAPAVYESFSKEPHVQAAIRGWLGVPMLVGDRLIGMIALDKRRVGYYTEEHARLAQTFAAQAAVAIENAGLYQSIERQAERLTVLYEIGSEMTSALELDQILDSIAQHIARLVGARKSLFLLVDKKRGCLIKATGYGYPPKHLQKLTLEEVEAGVSGWVLRTGKPTLVTDAQSDPRNTGIALEKAEQFDAVPLILAPLVVKGEVIGTLTAVNIADDPPFTEDDLKMVVMLANQAAIAIENAELMTKNRERLRRLEMLSQASNEMMSNLHSLSFDDRLNLIVRYAAQVLNAEASTIFLVKRPGFLTKEACYGHIEKDYQKGKEFAIRSERKTGLTGYIAYTGELFNAYGDDLIGHWAGTGKADQVPSGKCCSLLAIPLKRQSGNTEELIGTLEVENKKDTDGQPKSHISFTEEDEWILGIFAEKVVICLENAELYERTSDSLEEKVEDLKKIKPYIGSKTAVDWMRMVSTAWGHNVRREVGTALGRVELMRRLLALGESAQEVEKELDQLENVIRGIKEIPITAPLSYEDAVCSVQINSLVKTHLERQWKHGRYKSVELCFDLQEDLDSVATVRISPEWLRRALEILTDNAVQAMLEANSPEKRLMVTTRLVGEMVGISVWDTGPGIPKDVLGTLFKEPIDKPVGSRGAGIGLMLAQTIVQTYGGDIRVESPGERGTNVVIVLPIEN